jgi:hypothetical protein
MAETCCVKRKIVNKQLLHYDGLWLHRRQDVTWSLRLIRVTAPSQAWNVSSRSNAGTVGSKLTWGMDVCVCVYSVWVVLCVGIGLETGWSPLQGILPTLYRLRNWKSGQCPTKGCRTIERERERQTETDNESCKPAQYWVYLGSIWYNDLLSVFKDLRCLTDVWRNGS